MKNNPSEKKEGDDLMDDWYPDPFRHLPPTTKQEDLQVTIRAYMFIFAIASFPFLPALLGGLILCTVPKEQDPLLFLIGITLCLLSLILISKWLKLCMLKKSRGFPKSKRRGFPSPKTRGWSGKTKSS